MIQAQNTSDIDFINQEALLQQVERFLRRGESCALIGGMGMGKTWVLDRIKDRLHPADGDGASDHVRLIPVSFRADWSNPTTTAGVHTQIAHAVLDQVKDWVRDCQPGQLTIVRNELDAVQFEHLAAADYHYDAFRYFLYATIRTLRYNLGNCRLVFLLDDIYRLEKSIQEVTVRQWLALVDSDNNILAGRIALVISCRKPFPKQFIPNWSAEAPKNVASIYLEPITTEHVREGIRSQLQERRGALLSEQVIEEICSATGGYPLLYGSIISDLCDEVTSGTILVTEAILGHESTWRERHFNTIDWINAQIEEHAVMPLVLGLLADGKIWSQEQLQLELPRSVPNYQLGDALSQLKSIGMVRANGNSRYQLSGTLLQKWLQPRTIKRSSRGIKRMHDVFISYRHVDPDQSWVKNKLVPDLTRASVGVYIDYDCFDRGMPIVDNMQEAVKNCRYTLLVLSKAWRQSHFTDYEMILTVHQGLKQGKRRMLIVQCEECTIPDGLDIYPPFVMTDEEKYREELVRLVKHLKRAPNTRR